MSEVPSVILSHQSHMFWKFFWYSFLVSLFTHGQLFPLLWASGGPSVCSGLCPQFQYLPTQLSCQMKPNLHTVPHPLLRKYQHQPLSLALRALRCHASCFSAQCSPKNKSPHQPGWQPIHFESTFAHLLAPSLPAQYLFCVFPSPYQSILNTELKCYLFCRAFLWQLKPPKTSPAYFIMSLQCHFMLSPPCLVALCQDHKTHQVTCASLYSVLKQYL